MSFPGQRDLVERCRPKLSCATADTIHILCKHDPNNALFLQLRDAIGGKTSSELYDAGDREKFDNFEDCMVDVAVACALAMMASTSYKHVLTREEQLTCTSYESIVGTCTPAGFVCMAKTALYICAKYATADTSAVMRQLLEDVIDKEELDPAELRAILTFVEQVNKDNMGDAEKKLCAEYEEKISQK